MSVNIEFYKFSKRTNSTKQPTAAAVTLTANIKAPCSILNPVLELATDPTEYNYCYIAKFKRYYFVGDIEFNRGLWIVPLTVDVLASYKTAIGAYNGYVLRSASERNEYILDNHYINTANITHASNTVTDTLITWDDGVYIVNVLASDGNGTLSYQFSPAGFSAFYESINTAINGFNWTDVPTALKNNLLSPLQYLTSAYWFPKAFTGSNVGSIKLGLTNINVTQGTKAVTGYAHRTYDLNIPKHPQTGTIGKYVNLAPYSRYTLTWGPMGTVPLDASVMIKADKISVGEDVDPATGQAKISVAFMNGNSAVAYMAENTCGWGVPIQMSASQSNIGGALVSAGKAIASVAQWYATGDNGELGNAAASVGSMITETLPSVSTISSAGSLVAHNTVKSINALFYEHVGVDIANNGRPLCQKRVINTLSGYTVLQSGALDLDCTTIEREQIRMALEGGFYYE